MISLLSQRGIDINNRGTISQTFNQLSPSDINRVQNRILRLNSMSLNTVKNKLLSNAGNNTGGNDQLMWFWIWVFLIVISCLPPENTCF